MDLSRHYNKTLDGLEAVYLDSFPTRYQMAFGRNRLETHCKCKSISLYDHLKRLKTDPLMRSKIKSHQSHPRGKHFYSGVLDKNYLPAI